MWGQILLEVPVPFGRLMAFLVELTDMSPIILSFTVFDAKVLDGHGLSGSKREGFRKSRCDIS